MESFSRCGLTFRVADHGPADGPVVILLHGFPGSAATWDGVVGALVEQGRRVLVPDQRGYTPQARPAGRWPYRLRELVADVVALADAAEVDRFHLAGHDWGAIVSWALAAEHPERLCSLTALATPHPAAFAAALPRGQALRSAYIGLFWLPALPERLLLARSAAGLRALLAVSGLSPPWREAYAAAMLEPGALTGALAWYRALEPSRPAAVGRVSVPTCFVAAAGDLSASPAAVARTGDFVDGPYRLERVQASHWLPEDHADLVARVIAEGIAASSLRSRTPGERPG
jgi:pimeloyl-ACP methyl ester carboxylesterase